MTRKILLTGSRGYLGIPITRYLRENCQFELEECDLKLGSNIKNAKGFYDTVVHMAADTSVWASEHRREQYITNNVINTIKMLRHVGFNRLIFFSTMAVFNDDQELNPSSTYGATKLAIENYLRESTDIGKVIILRIMNPIGLFSSHKEEGYLTDINPEIATVLVKLAQCYLNQEIFDIHNVKGMVRDFIPIMDLAKFVLKIVNGQVHSGTYNIGSNIAIPISTSLDNLCCEFNIKHRYIDPPPGVEKGFLVESTEFLSSIGKKEILVDLKQELSRYIKVMGNG